MPSAVPLSGASAAKVDAGVNADVNAPRSHGNR